MSALLTRPAKTDQEGRKKGFPFFLILSCIVHVALILILAILFARHLSRQETQPDPQPSQVTLELPPPEPAERPTVDAKNVTDKAPENAPFQSDKNAVASSELPPQGNVPLPSQQGVSQPALELQNQKHSAGDRPAEDSGNPSRPSPPMPPASPALPPSPSQTTDPSKPAPTPAQSATPVPTPDATPPPSSLKLLDLPPELQKPKPTPSGQQASQPPSPPSPPPAPPATPGAKKGYQPETRQTVIRGNISNRGRSSVAAEATPLGRYRKAVSDAIGSRWYYYVDDRMSLLSIGTVDVTFRVNASGKVTGLKVLHSNSNESLTDCSVRSIMDAKLPPIPPDVAATLQGGTLEIDYSFTIY